MEGNNVGNHVFYVLKQSYMSSKCSDNSNKLTFQLLRYSDIGDASASPVDDLLIREDAVFLAVCFVTLILACCRSGGWLVSFTVSRSSLAFLRSFRTFLRRSSVLIPFIKTATHTQLRRVIVNPRSTHVSSVPHGSLSASPIRPHQCSQ